MTCERDTCDTCEREQRLLMFKNFTNECCNHECTMCLSEKFVQGLGLIKDVLKGWTNMIKGRALYRFEGKSYERLHRFKENMNIH